jgi:DNA mismatch repair protein MutS
MSFMSILFSESTDSMSAQHAEMPPFFVDLNLDQIVNSITAHWAEYDLKQFFYVSLSNVDAVRYRQDVFHDLENLVLLEQINHFAEQMRTVRRNHILADKLYYQFHKKAWFLCAAEIYCDAVKRFSADISSTPFKSSGFLAFREYLANYVAGVHFTSFADQADTLKADLAKVKYRVLIKDNAFTVQNYMAEIDYSAKIEETFKKFKQGAVRDYKVKYDSLPQEMNNIESQILDFVAQLNPELFSRLDNFCTRYANLPTHKGTSGQAGFIDETIAVFDREIHFYIAYLEHIEKFKHNKSYQPAGGLQFCYPNVDSTTKEIYSYEGFDLALAQKLIGDNATIVCNDFYLKDKERIIVVTGPNQGGKTTFARTFGQLHYLASIGCPVPGREAKLFLFDQIFSQFESAEKVENLRGKLEDDLRRVHSILERATSRSILIMNEIFNSTTLQDVSYLNSKVMKRIVELDLLCVWVTFVDELTLFSEQTVSMTSTIVPENPALRTFKVVRRSADGLAYALAIAEKYRLTYNRIKERIEP